MSPVGLCWDLILFINMRTGRGGGKFLMGAPVCGGEASLVLSITVGMLALIRKRQANSEVWESRGTTIESTSSGVFFQISSFLFSEFQVFPNKTLTLA